MVYIFMSKIMKYRNQESKVYNNIKYLDYIIEILLYVCVFVIRVDKGNRDIWFNFLIYNRKVKESKII